MSGDLTMGVSLHNNSYAARPDNSGLTLMRYAGHVDVDLIGERLSVPLDVNLFSDRLRGGAGKLSPSELDVIVGMTSTWAVGKGAIELGARVEDDRPVDRRGAGQNYADARARYLYSLARLWPGLGRVLRDGDVSGWATAGWFAYNRTYFARPDNSGLAFLRYGLHVELSTFGDLWSFGLDATLFTDKNAGSALRPSELDLTPELIFHKDAFAAHLAWEWDRPVDRGGREQQFVYLLGLWSFDLATHARKVPGSPGGTQSP